MAYIIKGINQQLFLIDAFLSPLFSIKLPAINNFKYYTYKNSKLKNIWIYSYVDVDNHIIKGQSGHWLINKNVVPYCYLLQIIFLDK